jgi:hypothetical protein
MTETFPQWRPIDTAPKDGSSILLCIRGYEPAAGQWLVEHDCWIGFDPEGRFDTDAELAAYIHDTFYHPTHWMPLPPTSN